MPWRTLDPHLAVMTFDDLSTDGQAQSQPHPRATLHLDALHPMEAIPDVFLFRKRDARTPITYSDTRLMRLHTEVNSHRLLGWRLFEGVGEIVGQHLPNAICIRHERHRMAGWQVQEDASGRGRLALFLNGFLNQRG